MQLAGIRDIARLTLAVALVCGCGGPEVAPPPVPSGACRQAERNAAVDGSWTISGSGQREGCDDARRNREFQLQAIRPLEVSQQPDREDPSTDVLSGRGDPEEEGEFALAGRVAGNCVDFDTTRTLRGDTFALRFQGEAAGPRLVGKFTGTAPGGCTTRGKLEIDVSR